MFPSCTLSLVPVKALISAAKPPDWVRWLGRGKWLFIERMPVHDKASAHTHACFHVKKWVCVFSHIQCSSTFTGQLMTLMCASPSPATSCKWQTPELSQKMYLFICYCQMNSARGCNCFAHFPSLFLDRMSKWIYSSISACSSCSSAEHISLSLLQFQETWQS